MMMYILFFYENVSVYVYIFVYDGAAILHTPKYAVQIVR